MPLHSASWSSYALLDSIVSGDDDMRTCVLAGVCPVSGAAESGHNRARRAQHCFAEWCTEGGTDSRALRRRERLYALLLHVSDIHGSRGSADASPESGR